VHDNFVTQWGDPASDDQSDKSKLKSLGSAKDKLPPEYTRPYDAKIPFTVLKDGDFYAAEVGFSEGFPVARDKASQQEWLTHCYGMVGVGRDIDPETGSGSELYAVIGQSPRALDRNIAVVGRVLQGMEYLSGLPRGTGPLGFYEKPEQRVAIPSVRLAADLPADQRPHVEVLRTDSATFAALVDAKRNRLDDFYRLPVHKVDLCSVSIPVRDAKPAH
jgi:peptidylprolyl isomerase